MRKMADRRLVFGGPSAERCLEFCPQAIMRKTSNLSSWCHRQVPFECLFPACLVLGVLLELDHDHPRVGLADVFSDVRLRIGPKKRSRFELAGNALSIRQGDRALERRQRIEKECRVAVRRVLAPGRS